MDPARHIDAVVAQGLAPLLKSQGFAKAGRSFHRRRGERWQVVNVQASSGNSAAQARFTLNLGLYITAEWSRATAVAWAANHMMDHQ